jgi:DNA adenine methylase
MFEPVRPAAPVAPWLGGKKILASTLITRIESIPHACYAEPFVGMGGVFLRRHFRPKLEVANDLNGEIVNLFRILQRHHQQLLDVMRFQIASRRDFDRLRQTDPSTLTDLERAARFLFLQRLTFGGKPGGVFGVAPQHGPRFSLSRLEPILEAAHERLEAVVFECLDWSELIRRYDTEGTLFYLDPPYAGGEDDYGKGMFATDHFARMAEQLATLKGAFIMSINDTPDVRAAFAVFHMDEVRLNYSVASSGATKARELVVSNREVRAGLL